MRMDQSPSASDMDVQVTLESLENVKIVDNEKNENANDLERSSQASVPFESMAGALVELAIFFAVQHEFYEEENRSTLYYVVKWGLEELALLISWGFWERPAFRTIMLRQLTVRNILFHLRYLPNFATLSVRKIFLLQPIVVLTLAVVHIITERAIMFTQGPSGQIRRLVSNLFLQVGVHAYLALVVCERLWDDAKSKDPYLWLRTCLVTLVFQSSTLMFGVALFVMVFDDSFLIARLFDFTIALSVVRMLRGRLRNKSDVKIDFSLDSIRQTIRSFLEMDSLAFVEWFKTCLARLHPLPEMCGFICIVLAAWTSLSVACKYASVFFLTSFCLANFLEDSRAQRRTGIYLLESVISLTLVPLIQEVDLEGDELVKPWVTRVLLLVMFVLSCSGLRDLMHLAVI